MLILKHPKNSNIAGAKISGLEASFICFRGIIKTAEFIIYILYGIFFSLKPFKTEYICVAINSVSIGREGYPPHLRTVAFLRRAPSGQIGQN